MARNKTRPLFDGLSSTQPDTRDISLTGDIRALSSFLSGSKKLTAFRANTIAHQLRELIQQRVGENFFTDQEWERFFYNLRALEDRKSMRMKIWIIEAIEQWCGVDVCAALPAGYHETAPMPWPVEKEMRWLIAQPPTYSSLNPLAHASRAIIVAANSTSRNLVRRDQPEKILVTTVQGLKLLQESRILPPSYTRIKAVFTDENGEQGNVGKGLKIATTFEDGTPGKYLGGMFARKKGSGKPFYEQPSFLTENCGWKPVQWRWADGRRAEDVEMGYDLTNKGEANDEGSSNIKHAGKAKRRRTGAQHHRGSENTSEEPLKIPLLQPKWTRADGDTRMFGTDSSDEATELIEINASSEESSSKEEEDHEDNALPEDQLATIARQNAEIARLQAANHGPLSEEHGGQTFRGKSRARRSLPKHIAQRRRDLRDTESVQPSLPSHPQTPSSLRKRSASSLRPARTSRFRKGPEVKSKDTGTMWTPEGEATPSSPSHRALSRGADSGGYETMPTPPQERHGARAYSAKMETL
jgi:hypothetical protein